MGMNVNSWYSDPAQRFNDTIFPQNGRRAHGKNVRRYDDDIAKAPKYADTEKSLSPTAKAFLEEVRKTYADKDMEFFVADSNDSEEAQAKLANGSKKYTILFTKDEIEKMATDREYCGKMLCQMQMDMHKAQEYDAKYRHQYGIPADVSSGISRVAVSSNADGTSSIFAEFEKAEQSKQDKVEEHRVNYHKDKDPYRKRHHRRPNMNMPKPPQISKSSSGSGLVPAPQINQGPVGNVTPENPNRWQQVDSKN